MLNLMFTLFRRLDKTIMDGRNSHTPYIVSFGWSKSQGNYENHNLNEFERI